MAANEKRTAARPAAPDKDAEKSVRKASKGGDGNVGTALRSVYEDMVSETIPTEMLDLLGKLS